MPSSWGSGGVGVGDTGLLRDHTFETHLYGNRKDVVGDQLRCTDCSHLGPMGEISLWSQN